MLALENWHKVVLVTGNNRNLQDRCLLFQRWLSYFLLLRLTPCLKEMRCTMRRVSNLRGHTTFTSFSSDLLLPLNSTIHNIVSPIPQNILSYTKYTSDIYLFSFQQIRLQNQLLKTNMIQQQLVYYFFISF